eukprot:scaffold463619_cov39-Prasinocladus_malaysianus.AAC.1
MMSMDTAGGILSVPPLSRVKKSICSAHNRTKITKHCQTITIGADLADPEDPHKADEAKSRQPRLGVC